MEGDKKDLIKMCDENPEYIPQKRKDPEEELFRVLCADCDLFNIQREHACEDKCPHRGFRKK